MNARSGLLMLLAAPLLASAQAPSAPAPTGTESTAAPAAAPNNPGARSLAISDPDVRRVLRDAAIASQAVATPAAAADVAPRREGLEDLRFRAIRRAVRMDCDGANECTAYDADGKALYTVSQDGRYRSNTWANNSYDAWLSCQSTNNLLTTFERFDKCRGVTVGVPMAEKNLVIALPRIDAK